MGDDLDKLTELARSDTKKKLEELEQDGYLVSGNWERFIFEPIAHPNMLPATTQGQL